MRRVPILPSLFVLAAVATMIGLGIWQLQRKAWKEGLIARFEQAQAMSADVALDDPGHTHETMLFRHSRVNCIAIGEKAAVSGRNDAGESGWAHVAQCKLADGKRLEVAYGWSRNPQPAAWEGGAVGGMIAPVGTGIRLIADEPAPGLQPLARPDPSDIPNNHLAYAVQWFLFAGAALLIYALALRGRARRLRG